MIVTCIGTRAWSLAFFWKSSRTSDISTSLSFLDSFLLCSKILCGESHIFKKSVSQGCQGEDMPIPEILRGDIFIFFNPPWSWEIFETKFLALVHELRATLCNLKYREHLGRYRSPFVWIVSEPRNWSSQIMILNEYTTKNSTLVSSCTKKKRGGGSVQILRIPKSFFTFICLPSPNNFFEFR